MPHTQHPKVVVCICSASTEWNDVVTLGAFVGAWHSVAHELLTAPPISLTYVSSGGLPGGGVFAVGGGVPLMGGGCHCLRRYPIAWGR